MCHRIWQIALIACVFIPGLSQVNAATSALTNDQKLFLDAERAIQDGKKREAESIIRQLGDYPLVPYLELSKILEDIRTLPSTEIDNFLNAHPGSWLEEKLRLNWLIILDSQHRYEEYVRYYPDSSPSTIGDCRYAKALIQTGRTPEAFQLAPKIWLSGRSRPNQCDFLLDRWTKSDEFSEEYVWQRFRLARNAGEFQLASYLHRLASSSEIQHRIDLYLRIREEPTLILDPENIKVAEPGYSNLIKYGIGRLASDEPSKAETSLNYYQKRISFSTQEKQTLTEAILKGYTEHDKPERSLAMAASLGTQISEAHIDWQLKQSLAVLDWQRTLDWIALLSMEDAQDEKWTYWQARARNQLGQSSALLYEEVSQERSYYGFLSAMMLERSYELDHNPIVLDEQLYAGIKQRAGVKRAAELHAVGYYSNARRAWNYAISDLSTDQQTVAAAVANNLNLHFEAIRSMAAAKYWNDLELRFPLAYQNHYETSSQDQSVDLSWIYGISRQESSFAPDIRSSSGAMGLMQVMPGTARDMARDIGVSYEQRRLTEPAYNIPLGTAYLSKGQRELDNNMIYATAGYNAGINRVKQWLDEGKDSLPLDVWIETIPYTETRKYVKNVMAYSVIYADKLGLTSPMTLHSKEFFTGSMFASR